MLKSLPEESSLKKHEFDACSINLIWYRLPRILRKEKPVA